MGDELDLETGDPSRADPASERRRRRRERTAESGGTKKAPTATETSKLATEIRSRLDRVFDRIAEWRDARDDEELATVIREDKDMMAQGIVSLTNSFNPLRVPLLMGLNLIEPLLAFGRVVRVLVGRWMARRAAQQQAAAEAQGAVNPEYADNGGGGEVPAYQ